MAKNERILLKKGTATFNLVGRAKVSDFTFKIDVESSREDSDWVYNQMNLGVDCGIYGTIYGDMMSGCGTDRDNVLKVHGKKENGQDDFESKFTIDWEDRFDEDIIKTVGEMQIITVGLEKDDKGKTVYKKFLSQYDAIKYIEEHLESDMVVNVKGNLQYSIYNENVQVKKDITSIVLSKAEEKDFKATFTQALLLDGDSIGKPDKETNTVPITGYVIDYFSKKYGDKSIIHKVNGKVMNGLNLPVVKTFDFVIGEDKEQAKRMLKVFKVKGKKITQLVVDGYFTKGEVNTVTVSEADIPDDIKELIDLGYVDKDEILGQIALKNGGKKPEKMVIKSPHIKYVGEEGSKMPMMDKTEDIYEEDNISIQLILDSLEIDNNLDQDDNTEDSDKEASQDDLDKALDNEDKADDDGDNDDWLNDL